MEKLIDADVLERNGWTMTRIVQVDANTMEYQTKKPTEFQTIGTHQWIPCSRCERKCEKWGNLKTSQE